MWRTESYAMMKQTGVPTAQRSSLRGASLTRVRSAIDTTNALLDRWASGATRLKHISTVFNLNDPSQKKFWLQKRQEILNSLQKNKTTVEEVYETEQTRY
jgi:hypothetical protein